MGKNNFNDGFKRDAAAQLSGRGYPVAEVSERLGISQHSLYQRRKRFAQARWAAFLRAHNLEHSMSRRGNCHDNAVAESFFNLLKRERIRRRTDKTREEARQDVFDDIEMFYNPKSASTCATGCCRRPNSSGREN